MPSWQARHSPVFLFRLLALANWRLSLSEDGMTVGNQHWKWHEADLRPARKGWFSWSLDIVAPRSARLRGVPKSLARQLLDISKLAAPVKRAQALIDRVLECDFYFSAYDRACLVHELEDLLPHNDKRHMPDCLELIPELAQQFKRVRRICDGDHQEIRDRNKAFVLSETGSWSDWFDAVEKSPLTSEQASAVVIMEDRNLLVAAAGSGKTSTIVAKTAYALEKGYCDANEILVLTFNKRIREELADRLASCLSRIGSPQGVTVETFNAFGQKQLKRLDRNVRLAPWAESAARVAAHIQALINRLLKEDPAFELALAQFSAIWRGNDEAERLSIQSALGTDSIGDALDKLVRRAAPLSAVPTYQTLTGQIVRSLQELRICNWLTLMGIDFEYERPFDGAALPLNWTSGYRPDFYYPEIECWHEHFGLNKLGKAPPWMSRGRPDRPRTYEAEVSEKRRFLDASRVHWFETTSADFDDNSWSRKLKGYLEEHGLQPNFVGWDTLVERFEKFAYAKQEVLRLVGSCLQHAKSNRLTAKDIEERLGAVASPRATAFLHVFLPIFEAYEDSLRSRNEIDFEDMVLQSADALREGRIGHPYRLILVDEFQDVSNSRAELVSALLERAPDARLFVVGDDWQSIYRFAGADISAMVKFEERYGSGETMFLTRTFRSNQFIADTASQFIMRNPAQIRKTVKASVPGSENAVEIVFCRGNQELFIESELAELAAQHNGTGKKTSVLILGRYNFLQPKELASWQESFGDHLNLSFLTVHKSKGLEADIVFLVNVTGKRGQDFPSTMQDDPLLAVFMPALETLPWAEERRLFYVALTRAREKVYVVTPEGQASSFVTEILKSVPVSRSFYDGEDKLPVENAAELLRSPSCPGCERGSLVHRVGRFGPSVACSDGCGYKRNESRQAPSPHDQLLPRDGVLRGN